MWISLVIWFTTKYEAIFLNFKMKSVWIVSKSKYVFDIYKKSNKLNLKVNDNIFTQPLVVAAIIIKINYFSASRKCKEMI